MQNKLYFFSRIRGSQKGGGSATWEKFPNNPVICFWERTLCCGFCGNFEGKIMDFWKKRGGNSNLKSLTTPIFVQGEVTTPFLPVHMCNISVLCLGSLCSIMVHWTPLCGVEVLIPQTVALYDAFLFIIRFMHWHMHQLFSWAVHRGLTLDMVPCDIRGAFGLTTKWLSWKISKIEFSKFHYPFRFFCHHQVHFC